MESFLWCLFHLQCEFRRSSILVFIRWCLYIFCFVSLSLLCSGCGYLLFVLCWSSYLKLKPNITFCSFIHLFRFLYRLNRIYLLLLIWRFQQEKDGWSSDEYITFLWFSLTKKMSNIPWWYLFQLKHGCCIWIKYSAAFISNASFTFKWRPFAEILGNNGDYFPVLILQLSYFYFLYFSCMRALTNGRLHSSMKNISIAIQRLCEWKLNIRFLLCRSVFFLFLKEEFNAIIEMELSDVVW